MVRGSPGTQFNSSGVISLVRDLKDESLLKLPSVILDPIDPYSIEAGARPDVWNPPLDDHLALPLGVSYSLLYGLSYESRRQIRTTFKSIGSEMRVHMSTRGKENVD